MDAEPTINILIVDDEPNNLLAQGAILEDLGHVVTAQSGDEALTRLLDHDFAVVLLDVHMPGLDGFETASLIRQRERTRQTPIIFVTASSRTDSNVFHGYSLGAVDYIFKPVVPEILRSKVAVFVALYKTTAALTRQNAELIERRRQAESAVRARDATNEQLVRHKHELSEAKAFLEHLIAASPSIVFRLEPADGDFRVTYVSPNIGRVLGYGVEDVVGVPLFWKDIIHPDDREVVLLALRSALEATAAQQIEHECRCLAKHGDYRWVLTTMRAEFDEQARPAAILCHALDITDRKLAEEETRRAERFLNSIIENVPSTIFVKDARDLRFVRLNRAAENLLGYPRSAMLGKSAHDFFPPVQADVFTAQDRAALDGQTLIDTPEESVDTATNGVRLMHTRKLPILDGDGVPQYLLGISEDITERKASEQALASAKLEAERANRAKSDFLSRMSHDLRTPLNAILGFAQLLEMEGLRAEQLESVRHILKGGAHLLDLINEVLDLARIEAGRLSLSPEPVAIGDIVQHVVELVRPLAALRGISFDDETARTCGTRHVLADRQRLNQILLNLLSNAVKYNRDGGRVRLTCEDVPDGRLRIKVSDTGAGIRPEKLPLLFQPFERLGAEQTAIEGTGLGLMLSKGLAEAMGGTLGVESEVDRGSTFWVELALSEATAGIAASPVRAHPDAAGPDSGVTGTVLYIEDNISNRRLMERVLARRPGVRLVGAAQGQAGLELARADRPDLILLDLHLPDMRGEEVLRHLWEDPRTRTIPVAVLSADATPAQTKRLLAAGASAYLTKPLDIGQVLQLLDEKLKDRSS